MKFWISEGRVIVDSPALLEEAVGDCDTVVRLPGGRGVVRALATTKS